MDLPPMAACPSGKNGRHDLGVIVPDDDEHDLSLFCTMCGTVRRIPVNGALLASRLDDLTADDIIRAIR